MHRIFTLALLLIFSSICVAMPTGHKRIKRHYYYTLSKDYKDTIPNRWDFYKYHDADTSYEIKTITKRDTIYDSTRMVYFTKEQGQTIAYKSYIKNNSDGRLTYEIEEGENYYGPYKKGYFKGRPPIPAAIFDVYRYDGKGRVISHEIWNGTRYIDEYTYKDSVYCHYSGEEYGGCSYGSSDCLYMRSKWLKEGITTYQGCDPGFSSLSNAHRWEHYDSSGSLLYRDGQAYYILKKDTLSTFDTCYYDKTGYISDSVAYKRDSSHGKFYLYQRVQYTHDSIGNVLSHISYEKGYNFSFPPYKKNKDIFTYNTQGDIIKKELYVYSGDTAIFSVGDEYTYDTKHRILSNTHFTSLNRLPLKRNREEFTYNTQGYIVLHLAYNYDAAGKQYTAKREEYTYNNSDSILTYQLYISQYGKLLLNQSKTYTYDADTDKVNYLLLQYADSNTVPSVIHYEHYFYDDTSTVYPRNNDPLKIKLYPQPARNTLNIRVDNNNDEVVIKISRQTGQLVFWQRYACPWGPFQQSLDISSLKSGTYILRIESKGKVGSEVFIKM